MDEGYIFSPVARRSCGGAGGVHQRSVLSTPQPMPAAAEPSVDVKDLVGIKDLSSTAFHLMAVSKISDVRYHKTVTVLRVIVDAILVDGFTFVEGQVSDVKLTLCVPCQVSGKCPSVLSELKRWDGSPVLFFGLLASKTANGYK